MIGSVQGPSGVNVQSHEYRHVYTRLKTCTLLHFLCHFKLCALFCNHLSIQTGVTVQKLLEILWMTLENNRAPFLCHYKLCASFFPSVTFNLDL